MDTLVIGLDGGDWDVIDPLIASGELPNLARLREQGVSGGLNSTLPPNSPPAWTSIHTGKNPGKHGIFDFNRYDHKYRRRTINATDRQEPPFWRVMNDTGISTGLFKVPFTYPVGDVDGFAVAGFPTPSTVTDFVVPEALGETVKPIGGLFEDWSYLKQGDYEAFLENILTVAERQTDRFLDTVRQYDTDFLMTVYDGSDRIQHFYWKYFDESHPRYTYDEVLTNAIPEYYRTVDSGIGEILNEMPADVDVILLSDHGFGPLSNDIRIDEWLHQNEFLSRYNTDTIGGTRVSIASRAVDIIWSAIERLDIADEIKSILPEEVVLSGGQLRNKPERGINWSETTAFFTNLSGESIYINIEEKFSKGTVSTEEYDEVVDELIKELRQISNPETGERIILDVHHKSDVFSGAAVAEAPDIIIEAAPGYTLKDGQADAVIESSKQHGRDRSGEHRKEGIFVGYGPSFRQGTVTGASVMDIAPTLLHLNGCPVPESMDGSVLCKTLQDSRREVNYITEYEGVSEEHRDWTDEEADELKSRLKDMGYIE